MSPFIVAEFILYMPGSITQLAHDGGYITPPHLQPGKLMLSEY